MHWFEDENVEHATETNCTALVLTHVATPIPFYYFPSRERVWLLKLLIAGGWVAGTHACEKENLTMQTQKLLLKVPVFFVSQNFQTFL